MYSTNLGDTVSFQVRFQGLEEIVWGHKGQFEAFREHNYIELEAEQEARSEFEGSL